MNSLPVSPIFAFSKGKEAITVKRSTLFISLLVRKGSVEGTPNITTKKKKIKRGSQRITLK